jgi:hypothetical protein
VAGWVEEVLELGLDSSNHRVAALVRVVAVGLGLAELAEWAVAGWGLAVKAVAG